MGEVVTGARARLGEGLVNSSLPNWSSFEVEERLYMEPGAPKRASVVVSRLENATETRTLSESEARFLVRGPALNLAEGVREVPLSDICSGNSSPSVGLGLTTLESRLDQRGLCPTQANMSWYGFLIFAWLLSTLVMVGRGMRERTPEGHVVHSGPAREILDRLLRHAGIKRRVRLLEVEGIDSPAVLGSRTVALPPRALSGLSADRLEAMLAHEVAHLVRRDPLWLRVFRVLDWALFFQPLNRMAGRGVGDAAEYLCDEWAVLNTRRPLSLAKSLAQVSEWVMDGTNHGSALAMVRSADSSTVQRVRLILKEEPATRTPRVLRWGMMMALLTLPILVAPTISVATPPQMSVRIFTSEEGAVQLPGGTEQRELHVVVLTSGDLQNSTP
jgi:hypothetical protein